MRRYSVILLLLLLTLIMTSCTQSPHLMEVNVDMVTIEEAWGEDDGKE